MNNVTELYLDYLDEADEYQEIFTSKLIEQNPTALQGLIKTLTDQLTKAKELGNSQLVQTLTTKLASAKQSLGDVASHGVQAAGQAMKTSDTAIKGAMKQDVTGVGGKAVDALGKAGEVAGKGAETVASKLGASPETVSGVAGAAKAVVGSPLGMVALGGAAAFGGYKLYKRFLSKSARACTGYSGAAKTSCMKSYMNAKKGQASTRGAAVASAE
jgi:hypothetical protein